MNDVIELSKKLIACPSVSPVDAGCQDIIVSRLEESGFLCKQLNYEDVNNFWATHGNGPPYVCLAGHTDVVPVGSPSSWRFDPFDPVVCNGYLYGRGACDMKTGLAALVVAAEDFVSKFPNHPGTICFLVTSDEESCAINGTARVVDWLRTNGITIDFCIVGEPVSLVRVGDQIKNGARGSLTLHFTVSGKQGHVSYDDADNSCHNALPFLTNLVSHQWDCGNDNFQKTSLQITNIMSGVGADNVVPGECSVSVNLRYCPSHSESEIKSTIENMMNDSNVSFISRKWVSGAAPFYSPSGYLSEVISSQAAAITGLCPTVSTKGGSSDGRFIAEICTEVVEFGALGGMAHQIDECICIDDLNVLVKIYHGTIGKLLSRE
ncbi:MULTISPECIES: succinyl-diaminopimelate desuccinylase [Candidatus Ichthyocystis]|uniref:Succinyl-diaminopimelate desuccinylase n=1 Tax=Candidatus Ichthyocystis hellenicum TaxID=1561003 RepID=A0A0S4M1D2_9BURK|nr:MULTISPECIES: succinyl-diaminopimelate desuccinylase [Ichthyocystis]CUT17577.1 putative succinyl-diaminopimelate desuccinylase [Candidatus Ichthyocystis hellenicum]